MAMKCATCGTDNPDECLVCCKCGGRLDSFAHSRDSSGSRNCVSCGRAIQFDANVCPYCGHDYRITMAPVQQQPVISGGMRILFYILSLLIPLVGFIIGAIYYTKRDPESKHVGKVCIILAIVSILVTVGLAAVLYVLTLGFGTDGGGTPTSSLTRTTVDHGVKFTFLPVSFDTTWSDVTILFQESNGNTVSWSPVTTDLDSEIPAKKSFAAVAFGPWTIVWCNITDLAGNGYLNQGDFFTLTTGGATSFSASDIYTITILYDPTSEEICRVSFTG